MLHKSDWLVSVIYQKTTILHFPIESIVKHDSASSAWFPTHSYIFESSAIWLFTFSMRSCSLSSFVVEKFIFA